MDTTQVLIAGAGPTGLVLALCLARDGVRLRIVDQAEGPGLASRAMAVHARTLEFYRQLGFADEVVDRGVKMERLRLREGGEEVARLVLTDIGAGLSPYPFALCFAQDDHERFLVEQLQRAGIEVEWGVGLRSFEQDEHGVRAVLATSSGAEQTCHVDYLCGTDGARSRVRQELQLGFPGGTYEQPFYVADVRLAGGQSDDIVASLGGDALNLVLPVRRSGMKRLIGTVPAELAGRDELSFADLQPFVESISGVKVEAVNWFSTYRVHHRVAAKFRVGRVFIAGDAGHIHSPAGGQGMNTGIGDAVNLAWKLAHVLQGKNGAAILDTYETERMAFARKLVDTTDRAFQTMTSSGWGGQFVRTRLVPMVAPMMTGLAAVRRMIFRTISQTRINYRESSLSEGEAGEVHGGDRLPWVPDAAGDNFASLKPRVWRLHVYGSARTALVDAASRLGLPLDTFAWSEAADDAGLARDAAYLLRPDGHVGWASPSQDVERLQAYANRLRMTPNAI